MYFLLKYLKSNIILLIIVFLLGGIFFRYSNYVPYWDGWLYINDWIIPALTKPFFLLNFNTDNHSNFLYIFLISFTQYFSLGKIFLIHFSNLILFVISIFRFRSLIRNIYPAFSKKIEIDIITSLYVFFPIILTSLFHTNTDFGVLIFYVIFLSFLLEDKMFFSALFGVFLIFSKETGFPIYVFSVGAYLFMYLIKGKFKNLLRPFLIGRILLFIPILLFFFYLIIKTSVYQQPALWNRQGDILHPILKESWSEWKTEMIPIADMLAVYVLNFNWILTIGVVISFFSFIRKVFTSRNNDSLLRYKIGFLFLSIFFIYIIVTFFPTFTNVRYYLPMYFLLIVVFPFGILNLIERKFERVVLLLGVTVIFFISSFRTFDPLSRKIYGTFPFGTHDLLKMTSITHECCGWGRDQLSYNLEFTEMHFILNKIFKDIKPTQKTIFAFHPILSPNILTRINENTYARTIQPSDFMELQTITYTYNLVKNKPQNIYYIEFPIIDNTAELSLYLKSYTIINRKLYQDNGYVLPVTLLQLKQNYEKSS